MKFFALMFCLTACGQPGPVGPPGPQGPPGSTGAMGSSGELAIISQMLCHKFVLQDFRYYTALFSNGMRLVTCTVTDGSASYESTSIYTADKPGATSGFCAVTYDVDASATSGFWLFTLSPRRAQYNDSGSPQNMAVVNFADSDCGT